MNKVTVTKLQMDAIEGCRDEYKASLMTVLDHAELEIFCEESEPINNMTTEQIVLAWYGHAEVEPDFVDFDEAMRALSKDITIYYHYTNTVLGEVINRRLMINFETPLSYFVGIEWGDLVKGKFTTEGGTQ